MVVACYVMLYVYHREMAVLIMSLLMTISWTAALIRASSTKPPSEIIYVYLNPLNSPTIIWRVTGKVCSSAKNPTVTAFTAVAIPSCISTFSG